MLRGDKRGCHTAFRREDHSVTGTGGYQLVCDATNHEAVEKLRDRKRRPSKPFAVMMSDLETVEKHCVFDGEEARLLESPQAPIVLLRWEQEKSKITCSVAPGLKYLGVMLPYTPLHHLLLREVGDHW